MTEMPRESVHVSRTVAIDERAASSPRTGPAHRLVDHAGRADVSRLRGISDRPRNLGHLRGSWPGASVGKALRRVSALASRRCAGVAGRPAWSRALRPRSEVTHTQWIASTALVQ